MHLCSWPLMKRPINVNVSSVNHPMAPEHFIEWVYLQTERGGQRKTLKPGDDPNVTFSLGDDKACLPGLTSLLDRLEDGDCRVLSYRETLG